MKVKEVNKAREVNRDRSVKQANKVNLASLGHPDPQDYRVKPVSPAESVNEVRRDHEDLWATLERQDNLAHL